MQPETQEGQNDNDIHLYNIRGKLSGVGRSILVHVVHEMDDGHDIQRFLCSSRCVNDVMSDNFFKWAAARAVSNSYSFRSGSVNHSVLTCGL